MAGGCLVEVVWADSRDNFTHHTNAVRVVFEGGRLEVHKASGGVVSVNPDDVGYIRPVRGDAVGGLGL